MTNKLAQENGIVLTPAQYAVKYVQEQFRQVEEEKGLWPEKMDFGAALALMRAGYQVTREAWESISYSEGTRVRLLFYQAGYSNPVPTNFNTANGLKIDVETTKVMVNPYLQMAVVDYAPQSNDLIKPVVLQHYTVTSGDVLATDWLVFDRKHAIAYWEKLRNGSTAGVLERKYPVVPLSPEEIKQADDEVCQHKPTEITDARFSSF